MKNRLLLLITLLSLMALTFACGGAATNTNNSNANRASMNANSTANTMANTVGSMANTASNMAANTVNKMANMANNMMSNKPANTAANKDKDTSAANKSAKPPKGSTFECNDATFSDAKTAQGACSGHGGIKKKL